MKYYVDDSRFNTMIFFLYQKHLTKIPDTIIEPADPLYHLLNL